MVCLLLPGNLDSSSQTAPFPSKIYFEVSYHVQDAMSIWFRQSNDKKFILLRALASTPRPPPTNILRLVDRLCHI